MTKTEYQNNITTNLTTAEALCADLRKLRILEKLTASITGGDKLVALDQVAKTITDKEAQLKKVRAELGKARRIVKHLEEIEAIENGTEKKPATKKAPSASVKGATKATTKAAPAKKEAKAPKAAKVDSPAAAQGQPKAQTAA